MRLRPATAPATERPATENSVSVLLPSFRYSIGNMRTNNTEPNKENSEDEEENTMITDDTIDLSGLDLDPYDEDN